MTNPTRACWKNMIRRCTNPEASGFHNYGGRGIRVCDSWLNYYQFLADMGEMPLGLSLDRINNSGNYEPGNCRWATCKEQSNNKRHLLPELDPIIEYNGEILSTSDWSIKLGIDRRVILSRLENNWSIAEALTFTTRPRQHYHMIEFGGENLSISDWAKRLGIGRHAILGRLKNGWSLERSLTTPNLKASRHTW